MALPTTPRSEADALDPVLVRQLKRSGILDPSSAPTDTTWQRLVTRLSAHYRHVAEDRDLLSRTLEMSSAEMQELNQELVSERDRLHQVLGALARAIRGFREAVRPAVPDGQKDATSAVSQAQRLFEEELAGILAADGMGADLERFAHDFLSLGDELARMAQETATGVSMRKELEVARAVQQMLLPETDNIDRPFLKIASHYQTAAECGGDWWTTHDLNDGRILLVVGDVTGHGVSSAIITGAAKAACDLGRMIHGPDVTPEKLLGLMNHAIHQAGRQRLLMTCTAAIFDARSRCLALASAGHAAPLLVRAGEDSAEIRPLVAHGAPLGAVDSVDLSSERFALQPGDVLFWYTDGLTESENARGETFGERRLKATLAAARNFPAHGVRDAVVHALRRFTGGRDPHDDVTFVAGRVA